MDRNQLIEQAQKAYDAQCEAKDNEIDARIVYYPGDPELEEAVGRLHDACVAWSQAYNALLDAGISVNELRF